MPVPSGTFDAVHGVSLLAAALLSAPDEPTANRAALRTARSLLDADSVVLLRDHEAVAGEGDWPPPLPTDLAPGRAELGGLGHALTTTVGTERTLLVAVRGAPFPDHARELAAAVAGLLALATAAARARSGRALYERLTRIASGISSRRPLGDVLQEVVDGAAELLHSDVAALRLQDQDDPRHVVLVAAHGLPVDVVEQIRERPLGSGVTGVAVAEDRVVMVDPYAGSPAAVPELAADGLRVAMAAPVHEAAHAVGALMVGSRSERHYSPSEQEVLQAFAEAVGVALVDARTVEELREAQRTKDMLLATVSHELKTPLTVVLGALRTLQRHGTSLDDATREDILDAAVRRGRDLQRLIDRLLQGARADLAGELVETTLPDVVHAAVSGFDTLREVRVHDVPDVVLRTDQAALMSLLGVLLENAVTHSPEATPVDVVASVEGQTARLAVANAGRLPADVEPQDLFTPFRRGPAARSSGVGLGLFIAARLAGALHGSIDVDQRDVDGEGEVEFAVRFPVVLVRA